MLPSGNTGLAIPSDMNEWNKYSEPNGFLSISYNAKSYANEITIQGVNGWEILGLSVSVKRNTSYTVSFNYPMPTYSLTNTSVTGLVVGVSSYQPSGDILGDLGYAMFPAEKSYGTLSFNFDSGNRTNVYIFFNFGYVKDGNTYTFKLSNAFTTWEDKAASSYESGNGSESNPYIIKSAEQLAYLALECKSSTLSGKYYALGASINLSGLLWNPIGNNKFNFGGVFDGRNYTISGMTVFDGISPSVGLFSVLEDGVVKNLILSNSIIYLAGDGGSIAGRLVSRNSLVENCIIEDVNFSSLLQEKDTYFGSIAGIIGDNTGRVQNCIVRNINIVTQRCHSCSGIVSANNNGIVKNCVIMNSTINGGVENRNEVVDRSWNGAIVTSCYATNVLMIYSGSIQTKNTMRGNYASWGDFVSLYGVNGGYPIPKSLVLLGNVVSQTSEEIFNILIELGIE